MRVRREKLDQLRERGITPYAYSFHRSHVGTEGDWRSSRRRKSRGRWTPRGMAPWSALRGASSPSGGMARAPSPTWTTGAARSRSTSGRMSWGEESFALVGLLDLGDWVGLEGPLFRTRMGEVTRAGRPAGSPHQVPPAPPPGEDGAGMRIPARPAPMVASQTPKGATGSATPTSQ